MSYCSSNCMRNTSFYQKELLYLDKHAKLLLGVSHFIFFTSKEFNLCLPLQLSMQRL